MSLFGDDDAPARSKSTGLFDDDQKPAAKSGSGLFDDGFDGNDSPWDFPTAKKGGRGSLVKSLLPASAVPEQYIDAFDALLEAGDGVGNGVSVDGAKKLLASSGIASETQSKILEIVAQPDQDVAGLGRNEFNVLFALVGLAQEGDDVTLDSRRAQTKPPHAVCNPAQVAQGRTACARSTSTSTSRAAPTDARDAAAVRRTADTESRQVARAVPQAVIRRPRSRSLGQPRPSQRAQSQHLHLHACATERQYPSSYRANNKSIHNPLYIRIGRAAHCRSSSKLSTKRRWLGRLQWSVWAAIQHARPQYWRLSRCTSEQPQRPW